MKGDARSLRERLRSDTSTAHGNVDRLFGACDLSSRAGYTRFLAGQAVAWETLRPVLGPGSIARADALRTDLEALEVEIPPPIDVECLPDAASLGLHYVIEGSRLGSTVILRELEARAPHLAEIAAYLRRSASIEPWKRLSILLQPEAAGPDQYRRMRDDALFIFDLFERAWWATDGPPTDAAAAAHTKG